MSDPLAIARAIFESDSRVELAVLFGSAARGSVGAGSDLDFAVAGEDVDRLGLGAVLARALGREVDVVDLATASFALRSSVLRDGRLAFERRRGAWVSWRSRMLSEVELDGPAFARMQEAFLARLASAGHG